jgi:hypothetical protein
MHGGGLRLDGNQPGLRVTIELPGSVTAGQLPVA